MNALTEAKRPAMNIKGLVPGLPEVGKIKIGVKGAPQRSSGGTTFQPPKMLDHFLITTLERGPDGNFLKDQRAHKILGEKPTRIPIRLLYDDIGLNFQSRYACFQGRRAWCVGDGEIAIRQGKAGSETVGCTCERIEFDYPGKDRCKFNGTLSVMLNLPDIGGIGGVHKLRTTSVNTVKNVTGSLQLIKAASGGVLAGIPLEMVLSPKVAILGDGSQRTVYVVSIEFAGTFDELRDLSYKEALADKGHKERIANIEAEARRLLAAPQSQEGVFADEHEDETAEVADEFYPDQAAAAVAPRPVSVEDLYELVDGVGEVIGEYSPGRWLDEFHNLMQHGRMAFDFKVQAAMNNLDTARLLEGKVDGYEFAGLHRELHESYGIIIALTPQQVQVVEGMEMVEAADGIEQWAKNFVHEAGECESLEALDALLNREEKALDMLNGVSGTAHGHVMAQVAKRREALDNIS